MVSSNQITTYIGTYTRRESFVNGKADGIYIYHLDPNSGQLTYAATVTGEGTINPSFLTLGPNGCLYVVNEITGGKGPHGTASAFAVDPATGQLRYLNQQSTHGLSPCFVSVEGNGRYCLIANYETGNLCVLPILADGSLGEATDTVQFTGSGPNHERQEGPHAHMVMPSPDGRFILAVDLGADRLLAFHLDQEGGTLSPADPAGHKCRPAPARAIWHFTPNSPSPTSSANSNPQSPFAAMMVSRARLRHYRPSPPCPMTSPDRTWARRSWLSDRPICLCLKSGARQPGNLCRQPRNRPVDTDWA